MRDPVVGSKVTVGGNPRCTGFVGSNQSESGLSLLIPESVMKA